jgi:hypothetical protein
MILLLLAEVEIKRKRVKVEQNRLHLREVTPKPLNGLILLMLMVN